MSLQSGEDLCIATKYQISNVLRYIVCTRMNTMSERSPALYEIEHNKHETKILFQKRLKSILTEMSYYDYTLYTEILFKIV